MCNPKSPTCDGVVPADPMSRRSVQKGKQWERECARLLEDATGLPFQRVLTESRDGNVGDVDAPGSPLVVQCKVGSRPNPYTALREAVEAAQHTERIPVALIRKNGQEAAHPRTWRCSVWRTSGDSCR